MILPVEVGIDDRYILTYCIIDNQSDACFITDNICNQLNIKGISVQLILTTMQNPAGTLINTEVVKNLKIRKYDEPNVQFTISQAYRRKQISNSKNSIPSPL